ncbi:MAG: hypothetical protein M1361_02225 [Patescibacteria group bacterium]|nr:hypothetical protein [Patescibacteria group bacterium]MCL5224398.1 hypothetical protein [Patescibacteria group bacterium]
MKKIYVSKTDSVASVIEKVISAKDKEVTLSIPRDAEFSRLKNNFKLLKREAEQAGKEVAIESVDDNALDSAATVGIKAVNPFFGQKARVISDIVVKGEISEPAVQDDRRSKAKPSPKQLIEEKVETETIFTAHELSETSGSIWTETVEEDHPHRGWTILKWIGLAVVVIGACFAAYTLLPQVTVNLTFTETPFDYNGPLVVDSNAQGVSVSSTQITVPGTIFSDTENYAVPFTPSASKQVSQSAIGSIQIYNDYSSQSQVLIKTTRFTAPDGRVYRLDKAVTIPGATISGGKLQPSSIVATVTADQPGASYNIATTTRFRIPGFENSPKYDGFYADSVGPITGGFVGEMSVPTAADIAAARTTAENTLESTLTNKLMLKLPTNVKVLEGSSQIATTSETISSTPDSNGQYLLTVYGSIKVIAFKENDILSALATQMVNQSNTNLLLHDYSATYGSAQPNFSKGVMTASLNLASNWVQPFNVTDFQNKAKGLDGPSLEVLINSLPGIKSANIKFWPFWVNKAPQNASKIHVDVAYAA